MADLTPVAEPPSEVEQMRRTYLNHEASVKSIGTLYYLGAVFTGLGTAGGLAAIASGGRIGPIELFVWLFYAAVTVVLIVLGRGLYRLDRWVRIPVAVLAAIGLIGFPVGTIINGYILYLVLCRKGEVVFSDEYREVIRQTPHIKYRSSAGMIVVLVLILAFAALLIAAFLLSG
jgi:hypothetical protein